MGLAWTKGKHVWVAPMFLLSRGVFFSFHGAAGREIQPGELPPMAI